MAKKILIVDDEWSLLELLRIKLTKQGYQVTTVGNVKDFWESAFRDPPDLLILDIWLGNQPGGTQLYDELLRAGFDATVPVIFISALIEEGTPPKHAARGGKFALYGKPFDFELMLKEIEQLLNNKRLIFETDGSAESSREFRRKTKKKATQP